MTVYNLHFVDQLANIYLLQKWRCSQVLHTHSILQIVVFKNNTNPLVHLCSIVGDLIVVFKLVKAIESISGVMLRRLICSLIALWLALHQNGVAAMCLCVVQYYKIPHSHKNIDVETVKGCSTLETSGLLLTQSYFAGHLFHCGSIVS